MNQVKKKAIKNNKTQLINFVIQVVLNGEPDEFTIPMMSMWVKYQTVEQAVQAHKTKFNSGKLQKFKEALQSCAVFRRIITKTISSGMPMMQDMSFLIGGEERHLEHYEVKFVKELQGLVYRFYLSKKTKYEDVQKGG